MFYLKSLTEKSRLKVFVMKQIIFQYVLCICKIIVYNYLLNRYYILKFCYLSFEIMSTHTQNYFVRICNVYSSGKMSDYYEPDFGTAYYRSNDPIKNLKIK